MDTRNFIMLYQGESESNQEPELDLNPLDEIVLLDVQAEQTKPGDKTQSENALQATDEKDKKVQIDLATPSLLDITSF